MSQLGLGTSLTGSCSYSVVCGIRQVEQLSLTIQMTPSQLMVMKSDEQAQEETRLRAINMTVNIDRRLIKLFELVENDLLGRLQCSANYISPYPVRLPSRLYVLISAGILSADWFVATRSACFSRQEKSAGMRLTPESLSSPTTLSRCAPGKHEPGLWQA